MHLTQDQAAKYILRTTRTITTWVNEGLPYTRQSCCSQRIFCTSDLDEWAEVMENRSRVGKGRPTGSRNRTKTGEGRN